MSKNTSSTGLGFLGALTILFIALKLTHYINWSWWWVLSPSLIWLGIASVILIGCLIFILIKSVIGHFSRK